MHPTIIAALKVPVFNKFFTIVVLISTIELLMLPGLEAKFSSLAVRI